MSYSIECVIDARAELGEGPSWDAVRGCLWWVDIAGGFIHQFDPKTKSDKSWQVGDHPSFIFARPNKDIVVGTRSGFGQFNPETGEVVVICDPKPKSRDIRFNDAAMDSKGRIWAGTMKDKGEREDVGAYYCLDLNNMVTLGPTRYKVTNGTAFSPDYSLMYTADTDASSRKIFVSKYNVETATFSQQQVFFDTEGLDWRPDGACMDSEGNLWVAGIGGAKLVQISPKGNILQEIKLPVEKPTKPVFGGENLDILYFTSLRQGLSDDFDQPQAGSLFAIHGLGFKGVSA